MNPYLAELVACGRAFTDGTTNGAGYYARGCVIARTGAGVYTITLDRAVDADQCLISFQSETTLLISSVVHTSDTVKTVTFVTVAAGNAATDAVFNVAVFKAAGGGGATGR